MAGRRPEREAPDAVRQTRLLGEQVRKELRCQKLYTQYSINPLHPVHAVTKKPMSWHDHVEEAEDATFLHLIHQAALEPTKKYSEPQTESQEIGWNTTPLIHVDRTDRRLYFPRRKTDISK